MVLAVSVLVHCGRDMELLWRTPVNGELDGLVHRVCPGIGSSVSKLSGLLVPGGILVTRLGHRGGKWHLPANLFLE